MLSVGSKGSDKVVNDDKPDLNNLYMITSVGSKGPDRVASDGSDLGGSKVMSNKIED